MKHYKSVDLIGNTIYHRYWDGERSKIETITEFPIELYVKGKRSDSTSIYGDNLDKKEFSSISSARSFIKEHGDLIKIFGQTDLKYQFIAHRYPGELEFRLSNFKICNLDIETKYDTTGFPTAKEAKHEITAITCKMLGIPGFITFGVKGYKKKDEVDTYFESATEYEMLIKFINWWSKEGVDIITGWNVVGFDIPYLVNRLISVCTATVANKLSPFYQYTQKIFTESKINREHNTYSILGVKVLDYIELYKKFTKEKQESYRLDNIAEVELGENKLDYSEYKDLMDMFIRNYQKYIEYNIHDVRIVELLDNKMQYLFLAITMALIAKVNPDEIFGPVKLWDNAIYNDLLESNVQIPPAPEQGDDDGIVGAYVIKINPGAYRWVVSFDLTSLYPSILMALNMSPETLVKEASDRSILAELIANTFDTSYAIDEDVAIAANGAQFSRATIGVLARVTAKMFDNRVRFKNKMLAVEREIETLKENLDLNYLLIKEKENQRAHYDAMQMAFKIALNSLYGATGCPYFRYFNTNIAEGITLTGQFVSRRIGIRVNEFLNEKFGTVGMDYLVAGDTDSVDGASIINSSIGNLSISDLWDKTSGNIIERGIHNYVKPLNNISALALDAEHNIVMKPVNYIMKHKVSKRQFKLSLRLKSGETREVICTEDHSLLVERDGKLIEVSPKNLLPTDVFIVNS